LCLHILSINSDRFLKNGKKVENLIEAVVRVNLDPDNICIHCHATLLHPYLLATVAKVDKFATADTTVGQRNKNLAELDIYSELNSFKLLIDISGCLVQFFFLQILFSVKLILSFGI